MLDAKTQTINSVVHFDSIFFPTLLCLIRARRRICMHKFAFILVLYKIRTRIFLYNRESILRMSFGSTKFLLQPIRKFLLLKQSRLSVRNFSLQVFRFRLSCNFLDDWRRCSLETKWHCRLCKRKMKKKTGSSDSNFINPLDYFSPLDTFTQSYFFC